MDCATSRQYSSGDARTRYGAEASILSIRLSRTEHPYRGSRKDATLFFAQRLDRFGLDGMDEFE